ncbi:MAG: ATP-NAD kinase-like domain-containing protein, partial [Olpidium bornovanus]
LYREAGDDARTRLKFWEASAGDSLICHNNKGDGFDLMVTIGGDGTVLHGAWIFQGSSPPIMSFHMGSLGFLTVFDVQTFRESMRNVIEGGGIRLNLRMRLACSLYRGADSRECKRPRKKADSPRADEESASDDEAGDAAPFSDVFVERNENFDEEGMPRKDAEAVFHVLNELVVDRGANPSLLQLELFVDGVHLTTILADGLVVGGSLRGAARVFCTGKRIRPQKEKKICCFSHPSLQKF